MCILYLFNFDKELSLDEIAEHMGFDQETCKKNVQSLTTPQLRILVQHDGKFRVNTAFKNPRKRLIFPIPILEAVVKQHKIV